VTGKKGSIWVRYRGSEWPQDTQSSGRRAAWWELMDWESVPSAGQSLEARRHWEVARARVGQARRHREMGRDERHGGRQRQTEEWGEDRKKRQ
jgi:hypothetical protein